MPLARFVFSLLVLVSIPLHVLGGVEGRVWIDADANGRLDPGEPAVAGCLVSDGRQLVRTDASGGYSLAAAPGDDVFVVNPSGTWPSGAWWKPLGAKSPSQSVDFALQKEPQTGPLVFVQGTDIHLRPDVVDLYQQYIAHVNRLPLPVRFVVHTGDLVVDALARDLPGARQLFDLYEDQTRSLRFPLRNVIGNHEHVGIGAPHRHAPVAPYGKAMYLSRLGPTSYAFRWGPYHFIALDGSTLDPAGKNGYRDGLDRASAQWACRYLETVGAGEPVVLLVHQPLGNRDTDQMLLAALHGKQLLLVLCGHGHGRGQTAWGGAPMIMGGAVSSAWHGFVPYPPDPWGYVVYRLDGSKVEHLFIDWSADRSFDLKSPAWGTVISATQLDVEGTASDFDGSLRRIVCSLGGRQAEARLTREGHLAARFHATLDLAGLPEGVYDLEIDACDGQQHFKHSRPLVIATGAQEPLADAKPAKLRLFADGPGRADAEIRLNGQPLTRLEPAQRAGVEVVVDVPAGQLRRLNHVAVVPSDGQLLLVGDVRIDAGGRIARDVRFAAKRKVPAPPKPQGNSVLDHYIDPTYHGPRGK